MRGVNKENLQHVLETKDVEAVLLSFRNLLHRKSEQIIRTVRYSDALEMSDLRAAATEEIINVIRLGKFKYKPTQPPEHNYAQFVKLIELRVHSAMMREKDSLSYPIHIRRGIAEKLRAAHEIIAHRRQAPRSVIVNVIAHVCNATLMEAVHLARVAGLSFFNGLTVLNTAPENDLIDYDIPVADDSMDKFVVLNVLDVLTSEFQRMIMTQVFIHNWTLAECSAAAKLPEGYVNKYYHIALNQLRKEFV